MIIIIIYQLPIVLNRLNYENYYHDKIQSSFSLLIGYLSIFLSDFE
jgi:hypothetical protein